MGAELLALSGLTGPASLRPPGATLVDQLAACGAAALLVALVCWQAWSAGDLPRR